MRPRRCSRRAVRTLPFAAVALLGLLVTPLYAQGGVATGGALELVLPVGARAVGLGQAVAADYLGSESVWWNPGALGRQRSRELAIHHDQTFAVKADAISFLLPLAPRGVLGLSAILYDYGTQDQTDVTGTLGSFTTRTTILAATFAADIGARVFLGVNYKFYQRNVPCTGGCTGFGSQSASTTALDAGIQIRASPDSSLYLGLALRNVGPPLQVNDAPQADPLPTRLDIAVTFAPRTPSLGPDATIRFGAGLVNAIPSTGAGFRMGAELSWQHTVRASAGYVVRGPGGSGGTIGLGASTGRLVLDIARSFSDNAGNTGQPPTYLSLRYLF